MKACYNTIIPSGNSEDWRITMANVFMMMNMMMCMYGMDMGTFCHAENSKLLSGKETV